MTYITFFDLDDTCHDGYRVLNIQHMWKKRLTMTGKLEHGLPRLPLALTTDTLRNKGTYLFTVLFSLIFTLLLWWSHQGYIFCTFILYLITLEGACDALRLPKWSLVYIIYIFFPVFIIYNIRSRNFLRFRSTCSLTPCIFMFPAEPYIPRMVPPAKQQGKVQFG